MANLLRAEYQRAHTQGWITHFLTVAEVYALSPAVLMAIASRETNMGGRELQPGVFEWLTKAGDGGHGFGLMQIDGRSFPAWIQTDDWHSAAGGIVKGAEVLDSKRAWLGAHVGQPTQVTDRTSGKVYRYTVPALRGLTLERAAIASYNCGEKWVAYHASQGHSIDQGTTHKNYSADVLTRATQFRSWLVDDGWICDLKEPA